MSHACKLDLLQFWPPDVKTQANIINLDSHHNICVDQILTWYWLDTWLIGERSGLVTNKLELQKGDPSATTNEALRNGIQIQGYPNLIWPCFVKVMWKQIPLAQNV